MPKRSRKTSDIWAELGTIMAMRTLCSRSLDDSGCCHKMFAIAPRQLMTVAPLPRTSSQKDRAEKRGKSAIEASAHSAE